MIDLIIVCTCVCITEAKQASMAFPFPKPQNAAESQEKQHSMGYVRHLTPSERSKLPAQSCISFNSFMFVVVSVVADAILVS